MLRRVEWTCLFWCCGDTGELREPDAVNIDQNAVSCAWGLGSWYWLGWLLFFSWSWHFTFGFGVWFCNGKCGGANVGWVVVCVLVWLLLVVAVLVAPSSRNSGNSGPESDFLVHFDRNGKKPEFEAWRNYLAWFRSIPEACRLSGPTIYSIHELHYKI